MQHILASARLGQSAAQKMDKAADLRKQEEDEAKKRLLEIEEKIKLAEGRKKEAIAGNVEKMATVWNDKMARAADVRRQDEERAKEKNERIDTKISLAQQRRENIIREQQVRASFSLPFFSLRNARRMDSYFSSHVL